MSISDERERFWQVQAVFRCEGDDGGGFAYTMGLADRGLHELHMWDRPTHGDDPAADFNLSSSDLCHILNGFADEWVAGSLGVGDVRELSLDDGLTKAVVTFGEPVDPNRVEAWGARPSLVVPLAWSLHRPPRGDAVEIMQDAREAYVQEIRALDRRGDPRVRIAGVPLPGQVIAFDVDGPYGPLSELVVANVRAVASTSRIDILISNALAAETVVNPRALMGRMFTLSRLSGRDEQLEEVRRLARRLMDCLGQRRVWRDQVAAIAASCDMTMARASRNMDDLVGTSTTCMLVATALDDVLPEDMVLKAIGPWRATLSATGSDPGPKWRCTQRAEQAIRQIFAPMDPYALCLLAIAMDGPVAELLGEQAMRIQGYALTSAASPPPVPDLVPPIFRDLVASLRLLEPLTSFAQLVAGVVDGAHELDGETATVLRSVVGLSFDHLADEAA